MNNIVDAKEKKGKLVEFLQMNHRNKAIKFLSKSKTGFSDEILDIDLLKSSSNRSHSSRSMSVESIIRNININDIEIED